MRKYLIILFFTVFSFTQAQDQLYKVSLLRAKPGELLSVIDSIKEDISNYESYLKDKPYLLRHSQGDHWDLMLIHPIESMEDYFSGNEMDKRSKSITLEKKYTDDYFNIISFQEEGIVTGPPINDFI
ncbi:MAG: hypothetical protein AB8B73_07355, partial [Ekhidna sp.]